MRSLRVRRPSAGLVVSVIALIVALGGTSYAAFTLPQNSVGRLQLKNGAVTTSKLKNGAVTGAKINLSSLGVVPSANHANTSSSANVANTANYAQTAGSLAPLTWTNLTLQNGAKGYSSSYGAPSVTKDAEGFVHLNGAVNGLGVSSFFATLPAGFRPTRGNAWLQPASTNGVADPHLVNISVDGTTGRMYLYLGPGATAEFVDLTGLSFYAG